MNVTYLKDSQLEAVVGGLLIDTDKGRCKGKDRDDYPRKVKPKDFDRDDKRKVVKIPVLVS